MKKLFLLIPFFAFVMSANAEEKRENLQSGEAGMATLLADDEELNKAVARISSGDDENEDWTMHFYIGGNIVTGAPDGVDFSYWRSLDVNWTIFQYDFTPKNTRVTLSAGVGFNWRRYTLDGHKHMFVKSGDVVGVAPAVENMDDLSSDIHTTSFSIPLLAKYSFNKNFAISLGGQLNWNYYGRIKNSYENGDDNFNVFTKKIGQRPLTVDLLGIVHLWKLGVYCKYSPMSVLKKDRGTEFKSLAIGVYF